MLVPLAGRVAAEHGPEAPELDEPGQPWAAQRDRPNRPGGAGALLELARLLGPRNARPHHI
eukprot:8080170-Lingulodinium_polyedra.AAC.1